MHYRYTRDLLQLEGARRPETDAPHLELTQINSPLRDALTEWEALMQDHPDRDFTKYILEGIQNGFRIGFDHTSPLCRVKRNMLSASVHPEVVREYIQGEVGKGRMIGPLPRQLWDLCHVSRIGVIPNDHTPGRWRLITDIVSGGSQCQ